MGWEGNRKRNKIFEDVFKMWSKLCVVELSARRFLDHVREVKLVVNKWVVRIKTIKID